MKLMPIPQETNKNAGKNVGKLLTGPVLVAVLLISLREYNTENHTEKPELRVTLKIERTKDE